MTDGDIARRIAKGAPSYAFSPDRGPSLPDPLQIPDAFSPILPQVALSLSTWAQAYPGACDPHDFGARPEDFTIAGPRTKSAIASFQTWANSRGSHLPTDGNLDADTFSLLSRVAGQIAAKDFEASPVVPQAARGPKESPSVPWYVWLAVAAGAGYLLRHELGLGGSGA